MTVQNAAGIQASTTAMHPTTTIRIDTVSLFASPTFSPETDDNKPVYGLTTNIETFNVGKVATHEYTAIWRDVKRAKKWSDKLNYIFNAPGWSHDGEDKRAKTLRKST